MVKGDTAVVAGTVAGIAVASEDWAKVSKSPKSFESHSPPDPVSLGTVVAAVVTAGVATNVLAGVTAGVIVGTTAVVVAVVVAGETAVAVFTMLGTADKPPAGVAAEAGAAEFEDPPSKRERIDDHILLLLMVRAVFAPRSNCTGKDATNATKKSTLRRIIFFFG